MRLIDADACPALFDEEFKETRQLILQGETHLDNLAEGFSEAAKVIRKMPTIDPESLRPVGRWETSFAEDWDGNMMYDHFHRDCGYKFRNYLEDGTNYCPSCGCKMEG